MLFALEQTEIVDRKPRRSVRELYDRAINFVSLIVILAVMGIVNIAAIRIALVQPGYWIVAAIAITVSGYTIWAMNAERRASSRG